LAVTGVRFFIVKLIPEPVKLATPAAIGAFLAHLGLQTAEGIGLVVGDIATGVTLGGCPEEDRTKMVALTEDCFNFGYLCVTSDNYTCDNAEKSAMTSATVWIGILGMLITGVLLAYRKTYAFVVGIGFVTIVSWFRGTEATYFPDNDAGEARFEYFKEIVSIEKLDKLLVPFTNDLKQVAVALVTFLYVDFLDTSGTLLALVSSMGLVDEDGDFPKSKWAFSADAIATIIGSLFGCSPVTSYIESGAGVEAGSRTGLTAIIVGFFFFLSIFFAPIIASIPPWATGGSLIIVGALMSRSLMKVDW
jgi:AGZA family xanthine/uracil permease-like MFS transporter